MTDSKKGNNKKSAPYEPPRLFDLSQGVAYAASYCENGNKASIGCNNGNKHTGGGDVSPIGNCHNGNNAAGGCCNNGNNAAGGSCYIGNMASGCTKGNNAGGSCASGVNVM